jgi:hypothetical protein
MSNPHLDTIISGITSKQDVDATLASVAAGALPAADYALVQAELGEALQSKEEFCTGCRYCLPCPEGIDIPAIMDLIAQYRIWGFEDMAQERYLKLEGPLAEACIECGVCMQKCTQHLPIIEEMKWAAEHLSDRVEV